MSLSMSLTLGQEIRQGLRIDLTGGWTTSIFPEIEEWLAADGDRWRALRFVGDARSMDRYRSVVDYLYAQVFPQHRRAVFAYYLSGREADMAKERMTAAERDRMAATLLVAVEIAYQCWTARRAAHWGDVRRAVVDMVAA